MHDIEETVRRALAEDLGAGDLTAGLIPPERNASAMVVSRENAVLCGCQWFDEVFRQLDGRIKIEWSRRDGEAIHTGQMLCRLTGPARAIVTGERTALNFLQTLSGTASRARRYADAVRGTKAKVLDTRKTLPGLRLAQKYAVARGGCHNHRLGLYDGILIKENHILAAGSIAAAVQAAKTSAPAGVPVEIEVENLAELEQALAAGADRLLLDNFDLEMLTQAVTMVKGRALLEASGNVRLENIRAIAETGVDAISVGGLTKNITAVDLSLRFEKEVH